jgi:hypothetical protein
MLKLQQTKLNAIRTALRDEQWDGLVAVFSQETEDNLLLVYAAKIPSFSNPSLRTILLDQLQYEDLSNFNGLLIGFSILHLIRPDLAVKGPLFYQMEDFFRISKQHGLFYKTLKSLVTYLVNYISALPEPERTLSWQRATTKLIKMALCQLLQEVDCKNLVAIIIPSDLANLLELVALEEKATYRLLYLEAISLPELVSQLQNAFNAKCNLVLTWYELGETNPTEFFIELREVLRYAEKEDAIRETLETLVNASKTSDLQLNERLRAEYLISAEDVDLDDLVAIGLSSDSSDDKLIYRTLRTDLRPRQNPSKLLLTDLPPQVTQAIITFPPLQEKLTTKAQGGIQFSLGRILWYKRKQSLARTFWLLSRDLIQPTELVGENERNTAIELAIRATTLYSLLNPWDWRQSRWTIDLKHCYADLNQYLETALRAQAESSPLYYYYTALKYWFDGDSLPKMQSRLETIYHNLQNFSLSLKDNNLDYAIYKETAERLFTFVEALLSPAEEEKRFSFTSPENHQSLSQLILKTWQQTLYLQNNGGLMPSILFEDAWFSLVSISEERRQIFNGELVVDETIRQLETIQKKLEIMSRTLFVPLHERAVLGYIYGEELKRVTTLLSELNSSAKLNVRLVNPAVFMNKWVELVIEITNVGRFEAKNLEVTLIRSRGLRLGDTTSFIQKHQALASRERIALSFSACPININGAELQLLLTYKDQKEQTHNFTFARSLSVNPRSVAESFTTVRQSLKNPYQFGSPIENPVELYGRKSEIRRIFLNLAGGGRQNTLLIGPRRIGKTSILLVLQQVLEQPNFRRYFELPENWDADLDKICPLYLSLQSLHRATNTNTVKQFFRLLLEYAVRAMQLPPTEQHQIIEMFEAVEKETEIPRYAAEVALDALLEERPDQHLLVLLDEYDEVYQAANNSLDINLRDMVQQERRMTWLISSTLVVYKNLTMHGSPWFNAFKIVRPGKLQEDEAKNLVEKPAKAVGVDWSSDATLRLMKYAGYRPAYLQLFCSEVWDYLDRLQTNYVPQEIINEIAERFVEEPSTPQVLFENLWLDTPGVGQLILFLLNKPMAPLQSDELRQLLLEQLKSLFNGQQLVNSKGKSISAWFEMTFKGSMEWVEKVIDVISLDNQKYYEFSVPIFKSWFERYCRQNKNLIFDINAKIKAELRKDGFRA